MPDKKNVINEDDLDEDYYSLNDIDGIASATECTGLIPSLPSSRADVKSYEDIYNIPQQGSSKNIKYKNNKTKMPPK